MGMRFDLYEIVEYKNGCIYKTKKIDSKWFKVENFPTDKIVNHRKWVPTTKRK